MKKTFITLTFSLMAYLCQAQYFQHLYGSGNAEGQSSGVNTTTQGHFIVSSSTTSAGVPGVLGTFTDNTGNIPGAPNFNNIYSVGPSMAGAFGLTHNKAFEINGGGYGIVGLYQQPTGSGIYYMQLDPNGNINATYDYTPVAAGGYTWTTNFVGGVSKSAGGNELYIVGALQETSLTWDIHSFVIKIDIGSGNVLWSQIFSVSNSSTAVISRDWAYDVIESPYITQPSGNPEVVVVGTTYDNSGTRTVDGYLVRFDATNGTVFFPWVMYYGTNSSDEYITSITVSNSGNGGGTGFVMGGHTTYLSGGGKWDAWLVKTNQAGAGSYWGTVTPYSLVASSSTFTYDVIERLNTSSNYEYYLVGETNNGIFGNYDAVVLKTDDAGNGVVNGEFTYGSSGNDHGYQLDQFNGTTYDGLSVYGTADFAGGIGNLDAYIVKSYFDGNSGCNESFGTPSTQSGPGMYSETQFSTLSTFNQGTQSSFSTSASDVQLCSTAFIPGASNARVAPAVPKGDKEATVLPNPMQQGTPVAMVEVESNEPATVQIAVYDMLGKQYAAGNYTLVKGKNQLPVDLSTANMAAGMYTVKVSGAAINQNILLMVK